MGASSRNVGASISRDNEIVCPFRADIRQSRDREFATCLLIQKITHLDAAACAVDRSACEVCSRAFPGLEARVNPVLPSLLFGICDAATRGTQRRPVAAEAELPDADHHAHLARVRRWAAQHIDRPRPERRWTHGCDVILCCSAGHRQVSTAIESVLAQQNVVPVLHLAGTAESVCRQYESNPQVIVHHDLRISDPFEALQRLLPFLRTPFVAIQDPATTSRPQRLATAVAMMEERGGEIFGSALQAGRETIEVETPREEYRRCLPPETLVFRRASLIDMGGFAERPGDADAEVVRRAHAESRCIITCSLPLVDQRESQRETTRGELASRRLGSPPEFGPAGRHVSLRRHAIGFDHQHACCDVVLPFFDRPDFVEAAMESLLAQQDVDLVIHLVDDCGPIGTDVFRRWQGHPSLRLYRNRENIGPFATFNNLAHRWETGLVAVQDADDVSGPTRMSQSANWLRLSGADIFGGRCQTFGSDTIVCPTDEEKNDRRPGPRPEFKVSVYPRPGSGYFLQNPTAMFRVEAFRQLGGYANFRERQRNRTGVDTELFARAYYAGYRFAITRDVVLQYRFHGDSATQGIDTGWGSQARAEALHERRRRVRLFRESPGFDPRVFGAMHEFAGVTEAITTSLRAR